MEKRIVTVMVSLMVVLAMSFAVAAEVPSSIDVAGPWMFEVDDDLAWKDVDFDDSRWEVYDDPAEAPALGFGWYRVEVEIPAEWDGNDIQLNVGQVYDFDWTFFNGIGVGNGNRAGRRRYTIPSSYVNAGEVNVLAFRVYTINPGVGLEDDVTLNVQSGGNPIPNPSFELPKPGPKGWTTGGEAGEFIWLNAATNYTGMYSVGLKDVAEKAYWISDIMLFDEGTEMRVDFFTRSEDATGETVGALWFYNADGDRIGVAESRNTNRGTQDWGRKFVRGSAPEGTAYVRIALVARENSGMVLFDDLSFRVY